MRERLALHRTQTSCNQCHGVIDPLGQALENFNAIGEWRTHERDTGVLRRLDGHDVDGQPVNSPEELRAALASDPTLFVHALTEKLHDVRLGARRRVLRHARRAPHRGGRCARGL